MRMLQNGPEAAASAPTTPAAGGRAVSVAGARLPRSAEPSERARQLGPLRRRRLALRPRYRSSVVDLLLGADNALVIALACNGSAARTCAARRCSARSGRSSLRLGMLAFANALLDVPLVKLIGAWTLIVIALNVARRQADDEGLTREPGAAAPPISWTAAAVIVAGRRGDEPRQCRRAGGDRPGQFLAAGARGRSRAYQSSPLAASSFPGSSAAPQRS